MVPVHVSAGLLAVLAGGFVVLARKGTRLHRRTGWIYAAAMAVMLASSFTLTSPNGALTGFHAISVASAVLLLAGLSLPALLRRRVPAWRVWHLRLMLTSYLTLVMTMTGQFFDVLPLPHPALNAIVFLQLPAAVGFTLIVRASRRLAHGRAPVPERADGSGTGTLSDQLNRRPSSRW